MFISVFGMWCAFHDGGGVVGIVVVITSTSVLRLAIIAWADGKINATQILKLLLGRLNIAHASKDLGHVILPCPSVHRYQT